ncbi:MAG TPA: hypothetical protein VG602_08880 [Actinomycetota bacterium]|nr:hypothetical protein [Actinomycetota bacterium]
MRAVVLAAVATAAVLAVYLLHPILSGHRFPVGPDGPVYTWLARRATVTAFPDGPGGGAGVPALTLFLRTGMGLSTLQAVTLLGPVLAATCGLSAAALVESALGPNRFRAAAAVALTAAFAAFLAGGWLANTAMVAMFLTALAALALVERSWAPVWLAGGLLAAAGVTHRIFVLIGLAVLIPVIVLRFREAAIAPRRGTRLRDTAWFRMAIAAVGGTGTGLLSMVALPLEPKAPGDTSQDHFFRRLGLRDLLLDRYRERLIGDGARISVPVASGVGLAWPAVRDRAARSGESGARFLRDVSVSWAAVTLGGGIVLALTLWGPPYRLLQFAFFLPVVAAVGLAVLRKRRGSRWWIGMGAAVVFAAFSLVGWFRQAPSFSPEELALARRTGHALSALPPGTPLVFVLDTPEDAAAFHVTRFGNVIRMGIPPERIPDVRLAVGDPDDVLAGRPTLTGDPEHDRLARAYLREVEPLLDRSAVLVLLPFNRTGYDDAAAIGEEVGPGLVSLRGPLPPTGATPAVAPRGLTPVSVALASILLVVLLALLGWGWARLGLGGAPLATVTAAPSVGLAVAIAATLLAEGFGFAPHGPVPLGIAVVMGIAGHVAAGRAGRGQSFVPPS